jgi:hypothetical protein
MEQSTIETFAICSFSPDPLVTPWWDGARLHHEACRRPFLRRPAPALGVGTHAFLAARETAAARSVVGTWGRVAGAGPTNQPTSAVRRRWGGRLRRANRRRDRCWVRARGRGRPSMYAATFPRAIHVVQNSWSGLSRCGSIGTSLRAPAAVSCAALFVWCCRASLAAFARSRCGGFCCRQALTSTVCWIVVLGGGPLPLSSWRWVRSFGCGGPRSGLGSCPFLPSPDPVGTTADSFLLLPLYISKVSRERRAVRTGQRQHRRDDGRQTPALPVREEGGAIVVVEGTCSSTIDALLPLGAAALAPAPDEALGAFLTPFRFYINQSSPCRQRLACRRSLPRRYYSQRHLPLAHARLPDATSGCRCSNRPRTKGRSFEAASVGGKRRFRGWRPVRRVGRPVDDHGRHFLGSYRRRICCNGSVPSPRCIGETRYDLYTTVSNGGGASAWSWRLCLFESMVGRWRLEIHAVVCRDSRPTPASGSNRRARRALRFFTAAAAAAAVADRSVGRLVGCSFVGPTRSVGAGHVGRRRCCRRRRWRRCHHLPQRAMSAQRRCSCRPSLAMAVSRAMQDRRRAT